MQCGLLGRKLGHSYSPQIHSHLGDYPYSLFEKEPEELSDFLKNGDFTGINVTAPYKKEVIPYLDALSPVAARLGAVNTIVRRNGKLIGHNTDYFGFLTMIESSGIIVTGKKVLVLGNGGASNTAVTALRELGAQVIVISRSGENNYSNLDRHTDAAVIVNTTPVGMYPNTDGAPLDLSPFPQLEAVLDVIYNPARTRLLQQAENMGLITVNGLLMLVAQAKEASEWFTGKSLDSKIIHSIHHKLCKQMGNIVLIGMPGCGKSTVGKTLAERLGKEFVDADETVISTTGRNIPYIIGHDGEVAFRKLETQTLIRLGKRSGLVIATGGGCVTQEQNYPLLRQNGTIIWLQRDLNMLPTEGRPLSKPGQLEEMYHHRRPLYDQFADHIVKNNGDIASTVQEIIRLWEDLS